MSPRLLPLLNLAGCLALIGVIVVQWRREQGLEDRLGGARAEVAQRERQLAEETRRAAALAHDVELLKESVASQQRALEDVHARAAERDAAAATLAGEHERLRAEVAAAAARVAEWEQAVAARDRRIAELEAALEAARARLDEAVARLRQAGGR